MQHVNKIHDEQCLTHCSIKSIFGLHDIKTVIMQRKEKENFTAVCYVTVFVSYSVFLYMDVFFCILYFAAFVTNKDVYYNSATD